MSRLKEVEKVVVVSYRYLRQARGCLHLRGTEPDCKIAGKENIKFLTGRSDCAAEAGLRGWETTREESHPNPHGNGVMTADFFR